MLPPPLPNTLRAIAAAAVKSQHRNPSVLDSRRTPSLIPDREELRCGNLLHFPLQPDLDLSPIPDRSGGGQGSRNESEEEVKHGEAREEAVVPDSPLWSEEAGEPEFPGSAHEEEEDKEGNGNVTAPPSREEEDGELEEAEALEFPASALLTEDSKVKLEERMMKAYTVAYDGRTAMKELQGALRAAKKDEVDSAVNDLYEAGEMLFELDRERFNRLKTWASELRKERKKREEDMGYGLFD